MSNKIQLGKKYETTDGKPVRILCVDGPSPYPVIGYHTEYSWDEDCDIAHPMLFTERGFYEDISSPHNNLVEVRPKLAGWVNVYRSSVGHTYLGLLHKTKEQAIYVASTKPFNNRVACIDLSQFKEGEGI